MSDLIEQQLKGSICTIRLNRADKKNALTVAMYQQLVEMLAAADDNPDVRVILLTGSGDSFSAGNDISDFIAAGQQTICDNPAQRLLHQLHRQRKPIVAAVNGVAIGIGTTILLHCDLAYAAKSARFKLPFVDLGLVPEGGSSALLPLMLGHLKAAELLLLGQDFDADQAAAYGLVNAVVDEDQLLEHSMTMTEQLAAKPPEALQQAKVMLKQNPGQPLARVIDSEIEAFIERLSSAEAVMALSEFAARGPRDNSTSASIASIKRR